jgi:hypothetical protein
MEIQGKVGPIYAQDGTTADPRLTRDGGATVQDLHGHFYESAYRGALFTACNAVAGVAPGTALGTAPPLTLWNPPNSGKNLVVLKATAGYVSGTLGAGVIVYAQNPQLTLPSSGTQLTAISSQIGNGATAACKPNTGSTVAATQTIVRPAWSLGASLATTAGDPWALVDIPDGEFIILPGNAFSLSGITAAGSTPLMIFSLLWEEVPQ